MSKFVRLVYDGKDVVPNEVSLRLVYMYRCRDSSKNLSTLVAALLYNAVRVFFFFSLGCVCAARLGVA